jgi:hypothetical protein
MIRGLKKELIWTVILLGISILLAGLPVGFEYGKALDVQMHDEYYVFEPLQNILDYWLYLIIIRYALIALNQLIDSNGVAAVILGIVNLVLLIKALMAWAQVWSPIQDEGLAFGGVNDSDFAFWWTLRKTLYTGLVLIIMIMQVILIRKVVQHRRTEQKTIE